MRTGLKPGEELVLIRKKHLFSLVPSACVLIIFIIARQVGCDYVHQNRQICDFLSMLIAIPGVYFIWKLADRFCERFIVTNVRLIHEFGVFSSNSKECPLDKINNTALGQSFSGRIFGYGDLEIQSAATFGVIFFKFIQSPKLFKETVTAYQEVSKDTQDNKYLDKLAKIIRPGVGDGSGTNRDTRECPYCAEIIKAKAKICHFCRKELEPLMENPSPYNYVPKEDADGKKNDMKKNLPLTENNSSYDYVPNKDEEGKQNNIRDHLHLNEQEKQELKKTLITVFILFVVSFFVADLARDILGRVGTMLIQVSILGYAFIQPFQILDLIRRWTSEMLLKLLGVIVKEGEESLLTSVSNYIMLLVYLFLIYLFLFIPVTAMADIGNSFYKLLRFGFVILGLFFGYKIWEGLNKMSLFKTTQSNSSSLMQDAQLDVKPTALGVCNCGCKNDPKNNFCVECGKGIK